MKSEPVLTAVTGLVAASIALLAAFGVDFTAEQTAAIVGWVVAVYGVALIVRSKVRPWKQKWERAAHIESRNRRT